MFYRQIAFINAEHDVTIHKVPAKLTDEEVEKFLGFKHTDFEDGKWLEIKSVKIERRMNKLQFVKMFPSKEQLEMIEKIHKYFTAYDCRQQNYVQMKSIAVKTLYAKGLMFDHIKMIMGYKNHASVVHLASYRSDIIDFKYEQDNFWEIIENGLYPVYDNRKSKVKKVVWVKLNEVNKY